MAYGNELILLCSLLLFEIPYCVRAWSCSRTNEKLKQALESTFRVVNLLRSIKEKSAHFMTLNAKAFIHKHQLTSTLQAFERALHYHDYDNIVVIL